ncbi:uncharacterized protein L203_105071 [Cryptococcus depauperatus CBS 7841]|uniref:Uncharacterized protein n=1 Tax=Cryptococcus depauperatus CBS 7841 TaxID=1295531 RepID=A0A1E3I1R4_9TREE|nr:hypothetical protein L203_05542 [Cryptococcus depauperatus CBS 7841]
MSNPSGLYGNPGDPEYYPGPNDHDSQATEQHALPFRPPPDDPYGRYSYAYPNTLPPQQWNTQQFSNIVNQEELSTALYPQAYGTGQPPINIDWTTWEPGNTGDQHGLPDGSNVSTVETQALSYGGIGETEGDICESCREVTSQERKGLHGMIFELARQKEILTQQLDAMFGTASKQDTEILGLRSQRTKDQEEIAELKEQIRVLSGKEKAKEE